MEIIPIADAAQYIENPLPREAVATAPPPAIPVRAPWVVRSLLHSLRDGAMGWSDDLDQAEDLPDLQLLALVNQLTRGTKEPGLLDTIDDWYQRLKAVRAAAVEQDAEEPRWAA